MPTPKTPVTAETKEAILNQISYLEERLKNSSNDYLLRINLILHKDKNDFINKIVDIRKRELNQTVLENDGLKYLAKLIKINDLLDLLEQHKKSILTPNKNPVVVVMLISALEQSMNHFYLTISNVIREEINAYSLSDLSTFDLIGQSIKATASLNLDPNNPEKLNDLIAIRDKMPSEHVWLRVSLAVSFVLSVALIGAALLTPVGWLGGLATLPILWTVISALYLENAKEHSLSHSVEPVIQNIKRIDNIKNKVMSDADALSKQGVFSTATAAPSVFVDDDAHRHNI